MNILVNKEKNNFLRITIDNEHIDFERFYNCFKINLNEKNLKKFLIYKDKIIEIISNNYEAIVGIFIIDEFLDANIYSIFNYSLHKKIIHKEKLKKVFLLNIRGDVVMNYNLLLPKIDESNNLSIDEYTILLEDMYQIKFKNELDFLYFKVPKFNIFEDEEEFIDIFNFNKDKIKLFNNYNNRIDGNFILDFDTNPVIFNKYLDKINPDFVHGKGMFLGSQISLDFHKDDRRTTLITHQLLGNLPTVFKQGKKEYNLYYNKETYAINAQHTHGTYNPNGEYRVFFQIQLNKKYDHIFYLKKYYDGELFL